MASPAGFLSTTSLQAYLADISSHPLLDRKEELALARRCKKGDADAGRLLIASNLRYVVKVAREFQNRGVALPDLIQEGSLGLMRALKKFDPVRGTRLVTYADAWIRAYIRLLVYSMSRDIRLPAPLASKVPAAKRALFRIESEMRRPATDAELAEAIGTSVGKAQHIRCAIELAIASFDSVNENDEGGASRLADYVASKDALPEEAVAVAEAAGLIAERLSAVLPGYSPRERSTIIERLIADKPKTLKDIGQRYGISRERIRQLELSVKKRLRRQFADLADLI